MSETGFPVEFVPKVLTQEEVEKEFDQALHEMEMRHLRSVINQHFDEHFPGQTWRVETGGTLIANMLALRDETLQRMLDD